MITALPNRVPYAPCECVGPVQASLLDRVARSPLRYVAPGGFLELRAARRLAARGILVRAWGWPGLYTLTPYADHCNWLVNR
jgi:hypothetical protein